MTLRTGEASQSLEQVFTVILGGGRGNRLYPLTRQRSEPAVPLAGKYRLIDIPVSNCINSGLFRMAVLTQYNSVSLHRHIANAYKFDAFHQGRIDVWAAEQTPSSSAWYLGTADAIRKRLREIRNTSAEYILILSGDQLYRLNFADFAHFHFDCNADICIASKAVSREDASRFGILKRDASARVIDFAEKPYLPAVLDHLVSRDDAEKPFWGSMGIYLFRTEVLIDLLERTTFTDFGAHVIPNTLNTYAVYSYEFEGFWEDIGTIRSFYDTNLKLAAAEPAFNFYDPESPIYSYANLLPSSQIENSRIDNSLICEGSVIKDSQILHSVLGLRTAIGAGTHIIDSVLLGADYYVSPRPDKLGQYRSMGIGENCYIEGAIIDKNVSIGSEVVIHPFPRYTHLHESNFIVQDGIVVIPKDTVLPSGTQIGPGILSSLF